MPEKDQKKDGSQLQKKDQAEEKVVEPTKILKKGNLAFPPSQQPEPLISFGQNFLDQKQVQALLLTTYLKGKSGYSVNMVPSILYGVRGDLSFLISVPQTVRSRQCHHHSSGFGDLLVQFEYSPYTKECYTFYDQFSIVTNVTIPTGSVKKNPRTGLGSNSFFLGAIYSRMGINWFYFSSYGKIWNCSSHRTKFGDQFLYQYGVGRRIFNTSDWLFALMIEFDGFYSKRDRIRGKIDRNSGSNIIYATPSIFISSKDNLIVQFGIAVPIYQHLFCHQDRRDYLIALNVGWTF